MQTDNWALRATLAILSSFPGLDLLTQKPRLLAPVSPGGSAVHEEPTWPTAGMHCTDEDTEARTRAATCPGTPVTERVEEVALQPCLPDSKVHALLTPLLTLLGCRGHR